MGKDTFYFSHDYNTRNDEKIKELIFKHGMTGYGVYWSIIEELYQNANALRLNYERIAFELRTDCDIIKSVINEFNLFVIHDDFFHSLSVDKRLNERNLKSEKARLSADKRWNNANALQPQSESNAIKEKKVKENNISEDKSSIVDFINYFNGISKRSFRLNDKLKSSFKTRLKDYTIEQIYEAVKNAHKDDFHKGNNFKYLTPEFILRVDKLEMFLNAPASANAPVYVNLNKFIQ